jgi:hypothetical protein
MKSALDKNTAMNGHVFPKTVLKGPSYYGYSTSKTVLVNTQTCMPCVTNKMVLPFNLFLMHLLKMLRATLASTALRGSSKR